MEKLGVCTDEERAKTASEQETCPICGAALEEGVHPPRCSNCGTEPFEKEPRDDE